MVNEKLIPTPLVTRGKVITSAPIINQPRSAKVRRLYTYLYGLRWVFSVAWMLITRRWTPLKHAQLTRKLFEDLGFLWIKVAQLLSLRKDLFSREFCEEMEKAVNVANPFPSELARKTVEMGLGGSLEEFFAKFEERPFAAGAISQIHRARLKRGNIPVSVKVMRPDTEKIYAKDMLYFHQFVRLLSHFSMFSHVRLDEMIWELNQLVIEETDFRFELSNMQRMRRNLRKHKPRIFVPTAFPNFCSKNVLITEYVTGVLLTHYLGMKNTDPDQVQVWEIENNFDPRRAGRKLYMSFFRQLFEENLYHANLNPANIVLLRNSRIALINFNIVGTAELNLLKKYIFIMKALAAGELDKTADLVLSLSPDFPVVEIDPIKQELVRALRAWDLRTQVKKIPFHEKSMTSLVLDLVKIMIRYKIVVTWGFMKIDRTWGTMEASIEHFASGMDFPKLFRRYFLSRQRRTFRKMLNIQTLRSIATEIPEVISEYTLFIDPQLRSASRVFQGSSSKIADALSTFFGLLSSGVFLFGLGLVVTYLHQHHKLFEKISNKKEGIFNTIMVQFERVPLIEVELWVIFALVTFFLWYKLSSLKKRFGQKDVRLPSASSSS